jgi:hypothetical protein
MQTRGIIGLLLALGVLTAGAPTLQAAEAPPLAQAAGDQTPPRLSYVEGQVSFWRPGAQEWAQAQVNTPLAPGDQLSTGSPGTLELQIGVRAFVRGRANTQLGLENQEPDFLQVKVTAGAVALDLRGLEPGQLVEVDTPNAAFTIEQPGYYRVEVAGERTAFITRRTGRATLIPASGEAVGIAPSEEVIITGTASPHVAAYVAPKFDDWDRWNYARTNASLDAVSARHVSPGTYGVSDLDRHGTWRVVPEYGSVWVPTAVQPGWAPYTTGSWTHDPYYGWTWVDTAPWGWAPYHYGRWVSVNNYWAWAPGPVVARPVYAPALVAFFGGPRVSVGLSIGGPVVGWVALGWGEPLVPWWGREDFRHRPSWNGWGGPRVVNNTVITNTTVVNVQTLTVYRNSSVRNAVVAVNEDRFGRGPITSARVARVDATRLHLLHTAPQVAATPASFVPTATRGIRPPEASLTRAVVATRPSHRPPEAAAGAARPAGPAGVPAPAPRLVTAPQRHDPTSVLPRPPLGQSKAERPPADRARRPEKGAEKVPPVTRQTPPQPGGQPKVAGPTPTAPQPPAPGATAPLPAPDRPKAPQGASPAPAAPAPPAAPGPPPAPPQKQAGPQRPEKGAEKVPPVTRQTPPQPGGQPKVAGPTPTAPQPPAPGATAPLPAPDRPKAATPAARPLPGEPANRLAPNRAEKSPPQQVERKESRGQARQRSAPEDTPRERAGGR